MNLRSPLLYYPPFSKNHRERVVEFRRRLDAYNKLVWRELLSGRVLEPLRVMYREPDTGRAWERAVKSLRRLDPDFTIPVGMALATLKVLHQAIHAVDPGEKARILLHLGLDTDGLAGRLREAFEELDILDIKWLKAFEGIGTRFRWDEVGGGPRVSRRSHSQQAMACSI